MPASSWAPRPQFARWAPGTWAPTAPARASGTALNHVRAIVFLRLLFLATARPAPRASSLTNLRLFIALAVPDDVARACASLAAQLPERGLKRIAPELMHLTLAFIGHVPESRVAPAQAALRAACADRPAIAARLGSLGAFPNARRPRVVWVGLAEGADGVRASALAVRSELAGNGVPFDDAPPVAHLTLARLRDDVTAAERSALAAAVAALAADVPALAFRIGEAILFESRLSPRGPTYLPVARVPLG